MVSEREDTNFLVYVKRVVVGKRHWQRLCTLIEMEL